MPAAPLLFFGGLVFFFVITWFVVAILLCVWVYKDAKARGEEGALWLIIVLIAGIIGLIIWLIVRPDEVKNPEEKCMIASSALPSQHPQLQYLRNFRDEVLNSSIVGRIIVNLYYAFSLPAVAVINTSDIVRDFFRNSFVPFWVDICKEWEKQEK